MRSIGSSRRQNTARLTITSTSRIQTRFHASETTTLTSLRGVPTDSARPMVGHKKSRERPGFDAQNMRAFSWANHEKISPALYLEAGQLTELAVCAVLWSEPPAGAGEDFAVATGCGHSRATASVRQPYLSRQRKGEDVSLVGARRRANRILGALTAPHSLYSQVAAPEWKQAPGRVALLGRTAQFVQRDQRRRRPPARRTPRWGRRRTADPSRSRLPPRARGGRACTSSSVSTRCPSPVIRWSRSWCGAACSVRRAAAGSAGWT